jgi:hypothetical protein
MSMTIYMFMEKKKTEEEEEENPQESMNHP